MLGRPLRVLVQHRRNAKQQPGGDTVVMDRLMPWLSHFGVEVEVDLTEERDPAGFDVVQLFNFALPEITEKLARRAVSANVPYVVTTLYEDWPQFFNKRITQYAAFKKYVELGQPRAVWPQFREIILNSEAHPKCDNTWTANNAAALIATGEQEAANLGRDYPTAKLIAKFHCGCEVTTKEADPDLFFRETGIRDHILCVGRIEDRKNQLMILKALEDVNIPVVFAGSGFTYQPYYEEVCRAFRRTGETHYLPRLSPELLASAYASARAHALVSWYELPGLVSLEAAYYGTNVVVTDCGTIRDYLGNDAWYCDPSNPENVRQVILDAYNSAKRNTLKSRVKSFTWERAAIEHYDIYQQVAKKDAHISFVSKAAPKPRPMRVLVQMRPDAAEIPGGDSVLMENATKALNNLGVAAEIDLKAEKNPADYDLVHIYNFSTPQPVELLAKRAHAAKTPYVVTTLYEERPIFFNQMQIYAAGLSEYINTGQNQQIWPQVDSAIQSALAEAGPAPMLDNSWAARHAAALIASGPNEVKLLEKYYPACCPIYVTHFGVQSLNRPVSADLFRTHAKLEDEFLLCVGRIEWRKNQLMLLKALEDWSGTVVFASSGFTYQPEYAEAATRFKRSGKTLFIPRIEAELLISAYAAAKVHALPSWYELPGLVSIEAARENCQVVVSDRGTIREYLGDKAFYCRPESAESIYQAVAAAWKAPKNPHLKPLAESYTWDRLAKETLAVYEAVLTNYKQPSSSFATSDQNTY